MDKDVATFLSQMGISVLRALSLRSKVYLCKELAGQRNLVLKIIDRQGQPTCREAMTLHFLATQGWQYCPRLYFSLRTDNNFLLGLEYFPLEHRSLNKLQLNQQQSKKVWERLQLIVKELNQKYGVFHGDIAPQNILVGPGDQFSHLVFIDWEFSVIHETKNVHDYVPYYGTRGHSDHHNHHPSFRWDEVSLEKLHSWLFKHKEFFSESI